MRAVTYQGKKKIDVATVDDPTIVEPTDAIIFQGVLERFTQ